MVCDLAEALRPAFQLVDIGLIHSARPGMTLVARLLPTRRAHVSSLIRYCRTELTGLTMGERTL